MEIADANYILRYLLKDNEQQYHNASHVFENKSITIPGEIIAEVVYVLQKVYKIQNELICNALTWLIDYPNVILDQKPIIRLALKLLSQNNLDYADNLLLAYHEIREAKIHTFDKKLIKALKAKRS
ncbi:PIN domain-containing protein [Alkalitalea saponilacus]|uniref:Predicted nucleic-acid-binding protein, contains PIN domain n=1 Tax=Alkalitalea saponilacus TaxID=889453 RepID=A0A1T5H0R3_9BACT|nr:PIN domain-containing protein [Alkalitalea saponilacus]ASB50940.1 pilus assembly protein [Alkalitalea saponilacus]SKC14293.1 Predicted nucleic-acid-binding protein, contains PIN domain [Alkalitalea saponilacus]